jgi:AcrR family transcriptional regulator
MKADQATEAGGIDSVSRRDLAVARSLDSARLRAEERVQRFLDAGFDILNSGKEFTVQEVVERSGQSLRSFYQYFEGKYDLMLALFEELVQFSADELSRVISDIDDPGERIHRFIVEYHRICQPMEDGRPAIAPKRGQAPAMAEFGQQLMTAHPKEASKAFAPVVVLFTELLNEGAQAGAVRQYEHPVMTASVILQGVLFNSFSVVISGSTWPLTTDPAEEFWLLLSQGLRPGKGES